MLYISYSQNDSSIVSAICQILIENGEHLNEDCKQIVGGDFAQELTKRIELAEAIVCFYSENADKSTWVKREIEYSLSKNKNIIPIFLSNNDGSSWFCSRFGENDIIYYDGEDVNSVSEKIIESLSALRNKSAINLESTENINDNVFSNSSQQEVLKNSLNKLGYWICGVLCFVILGLFIYLVVLIWSVDPMVADVTKSSANEDSEVVTLDEDEFSYLNEDICKMDTFACDTVGTRQEIQKNGLVFKGSQDNENSGINNENEQIYIENNSEEEINDTSTNADDSFNWIYIFVSFFVGCGMAILLKRVKRKDNIKLSSDISSKISIDGCLHKIIEPREVYSIQLEKGEYIVDFEDKNDENCHKTHEVNTRDCKSIFARFLDDSLQKEKTIKCFIAGSKILQRERDALRAASCIMYNKWTMKKFRILTYTYEDFCREHTIIPPQELYNKFIENETDWAIFVIDGEIGGISEDEYRVAMKSFKSNGFPKILALVKVGSEKSKKVAAIKNEINKEHQYWTEYNDLESMKLIFESTLNWDLIHMFQ